MHQSLDFSNILHLKKVRIPFKGLKETAEKTFLVKIFTLNMIFLLEKSLNLFLTSFTSRLTV